MANQKKEILATLFSDEVAGPFVTFLLNTHVAHQDVEKDAIVFKNFAKAAKSRFEKKFPDEDWSSFQKRIDALLADTSFWRNGTASVSIILAKNDTLIKRLSVSVNDQYYVEATPYLLGLVKDKQFHYRYYLLALNRDSFQLYFVDQHHLSTVELPKDAPVDIVTALGADLTGGSLNYSIQGGSGFNSGSKEGLAFHGVNPKDKEVEIDWVNYYQAVDTYLKDHLDNPNKWPLYLYALPENQTLFKKIAKIPYFDCSVSVAASPAQATTAEMKTAVEKINTELEKKETDSYNQLLNRKYLDQCVDIQPAAKAGKISHFFIATALLTNEGSEMTSAEYDRREILNTIAYEVLQNGGHVFVLEQQNAPDEKSLVAVLRY
ncbi:hypothetical protein ACSFB8_05665 [Enterococcus faecalis]